jgi:hypothetical protein
MPVALASVDLSVAAVAEVVIVSAAAVAEVVIEIGAATLSFDFQNAV